jgi:EmrB/QacA subfamily drug resistance transporter
MSRPARSRAALLAIISLGTLSSTLDGGMVSVAYPAIATAFDADTSTVLWITVAYWVVAVGLLLTLGWLGDVAGRRVVFASGLAVFAVGLVLTSVSASIWQLIAFRVLQGVGSAMVLSNLNALITTNFPPEDRGKALGISGAVVGFGLTAGPLLGGVLLDHLGWRAVFYSRVPVSALGAILVWRLLPPDRVAGGRFRVDFIGAAAMFGALSSILLVINQGGRLGFSSAPVLALAVIASISLPVLVWSERRSVRPILEIGLLRSRQYGFSLLVLVSHYLSQGGILLVMPFFLLNSLGFSATKMGLFLAAFSLGRTFLAPVAGRLSDRFGTRPFLVLGNALLAIALFWLSRQGADAGDLALLGGLLLASAGSSFFEPVVTSAIMGAVPEERTGTASASIALGRQTAFAIGVTVAGAIFAIRERVYIAGAGSEGVAGEAIAGAFGDTVLAGAVVAAIAIAFSMGTLGRPARVGLDG